jgi:5-methyltetrahydrofolate--homocysteine methyltransferase
MTRPPQEDRGLPTEVGLRALSESVVDGDGARALRLVGRALEEGVAPQSIITDGLIAGMAVVGARFADGELYVPEVLVAARAMNGCLAHLRPLLTDHAIPSHGKVVIATVKEDIHEIGKNLVAIMLRGHGFEVVDLGVDTAPAAVVDAARVHGADVVALSALLTTTMPNMKEVVDALAGAGLRDGVKVVVGGAPLTQAFALEIGADGYAPDAARAVDAVTRLLHPPTADGLRLQIPS